MSDPIPINEITPADQLTPAEHIEDTAITTEHLHISLRGVIAVLVVLTVCFMSLYGMEVKEPLYTLSAMTVGWYFGRQPQKKLT